MPMQWDVPTAWAAAPLESPCAIGLLMPTNLRNGNPMTAPRIPVRMTMMAVNEGMPPVIWATSIANGVVADFGAREMATSRVAPRYFAIRNAETAPTAQAVNWLARIGTVCLRIC